MYGLAGDNQVVTMAQKIVMWGSKSPEAQHLPPFVGTFEFGSMSLKMDGRVNPDKVRFEMENVPMSESQLNFFKKFGQTDAITNEWVIDADTLSFTDYVPFAIQMMVETFLGTSLDDKKQNVEPEETPVMHNTVPDVKEEDDFMTMEAA